MIFALVFPQCTKDIPSVYQKLRATAGQIKVINTHDLDVMLDCVPYNKFMWGGDCGLIEESVGSLEFGKDVVAEVLAKR